MHPENYHNISAETEENIRRSLNNAKVRFREELGFTPSLFAYPFGTYNKKYRNIVAKNGFNAVFGQQSGVAYGLDNLAGEPLAALPRFTMTENYGDISRFLMTANALPLPIIEATPNSKKGDKASQSIGFTLPNALTKSISTLTCFASGQAKPHLSILSDNRVELRLKSSPRQERLRINCTLPVTNIHNEDTHWRWLGMLFTSS